MSDCSICPRHCHVDRSKSPGFCGMPDTLRIARAAPHFWEEPSISGTNGSGAVFFSGCNLHCCFCQNHDIASCCHGTDCMPDALVRILLHLQAKGVHNINLVTASHYTHQLIPVLQAAKSQGLRLPIVWNSSAYESVETLRLLDGLVDIYLPDFKYWDCDTAKRYAHAPDYPDIAKAAIAEMVRQVSALQMDANGILRHVVQVRHLVLPKAGQAARQILWYLHQTYGDRIGISIMSQYTPMPQVADDPVLSLRLSPKEYDRIVRYANQIGIEHAFIQELDSGSSAYIPDFFADLPDTAPRNGFPHERSWSL